MKRLEQIILISTFISFSWLAMQAVHELGHVLGALSSGGQITKVVLHPSVISRTDVYPNPHPLFVVWAGPVFGSFLPVMVFLLANAMHSPGIYLFRFFAGFCLVANGVYIGFGSIQGLADAGDMLRHGASRWQLILFGFLTTPLGFYLWHGLGPKFGLGEARGNVSRSAVLISIGLLIFITGVEIVIGIK